MKKMVVFLTPRFLPLNILKETDDIRYKFSQSIIYFGQLIVFVQKKKRRLYLLKKIDTFKPLVVTTSKLV
jgi:hypothetical protein